LNVPMYWMRPPHVVSAAAGFHRFVWDLRLPSPDALSRDFPISAIFGDTVREPLGPWVLPGQYTVTLTAGGKTETQPLTVAIDPRVKTPAADLARQFETATKICAAMHEDGEALRQVRALRRQIRSLRQRADKTAGDALDTLDGKAAALEGSGRSGRAARAASEQNLTRSNGDLAALLEVIEGADAGPTAATLSALEETLKTLESPIARWKEIQTRDVPSLNRELQKAQLPVLDFTTERER
jgi:hypothetical protein